MRLRPLLFAVLLALLAPGSAHAAGLYVTSQRDNTANAGITGLISLSDGGGESQAERLYRGSDTLVDGRSALEVSGELARIDGRELRIAVARA